MTRESKPRKVKAFTKKWWKEANEVALAAAPKVGACNACNRPTLSGFCCDFCDSGSGCHDEEGNKV